jgi:hypothetical protein
MNVGDTVEIGIGSAMETRKIASLGTAAGNPTTLWQPLPDGPVMTIPVGSNNVPVTSVNGFTVGEKIGIGYGATYPTVANTVEKYEVATVTAVGKQGTQGWLSMDAKAGDTNIKVFPIGNISVGDKIRLDIESLGYGIETVTVTKVGTQSVRNTFNGPLRDGEDSGTGLDLAEPLKFNHASNMPFSNRGTGITFEPATAFAHSSNEPVIPLGTGVTLDRPLERDHEINAVVRDPAVTTAGYQGPATPNQWFGGPALANAGNMVLRDAAGLVVDSLNYGLLVDPWAAEGYQAKSGAGQSGCTVPAPSLGGGRGGGGGFGPGGPGAQAAGGANRSAGRFPDGNDTDSNCLDFLLQAATVMPIAADAGATNIKVASVADFVVGQTIIIGTGENRETGVIATVGTAGGTTVRTATDVGATVIPVASGFGFVAGQTITIDSGANTETAVVATVGGGGRRGGGGGPGAATAPGGPGGRGGGGRGGPGGASITVTAPLKFAHAAETAVAGTGITLNAPLTKPHANGVPIAGNIPTPGAPNQYQRRPQ